jgi:hypothetical protein
VALTDATAIAAREIIKGNAVDPSAVNFFYTQSTESSRHCADVQENHRGDAPSTFR